MSGDWRHFIGAAAILAIGLSPAGHAASPADVLTATSATGGLYATPADELLGANPYRVRTWIRQRMIRESDLERFGLFMDDAWQERAADKPVVILIHGFNSTPARNSSLIVPVRRAGYPCGVFAYPNDHSIPQSAKLLAEELQRFAALHPERRVTLLCHSMGSMVARACVEDPRCNPGNVDRLIMIAPPTHGTLVARFAIGSDLWEHWLARKNGGPWTRVRDSVVDGLGEAALELRPDSDFLQALNARPRNPHIRYSIILGTGARVSEAEAEWIRQTVCDCLAATPGFQGGAERLEAMLSDIDELIEGRGDGVVAVKRGRLDGVGDVILLPFGHLAVAGDERDDAVLGVHRAVLERVQ